jgi:hypothetical protein
MARARYYGVFAFIVACLLLELIPYFDLASARDNSFVILSSADAARTNVTNDPVSIPAKAYDWLARQPPDVAVFNYPARPDANRQYMYGLQYHGHPMLNGQASFFPTWYANVDWNTFPTPSIFFQLKSRGINYVLVHNRLMTDAERARLNRRMGDYLTDGWLRYMSSYDDVDVYELAPVAPLEAVRIEFDAPVVGTGWDMPEHDNNNRTFTWTSSPTATLDVWIKRSNNLKAEFLVNNAMTTGILDSLRLSVNGIDVPLERRARAEGDLFSGIIPASAYKGRSDLLEFAFQTSSVIRPSAIDPNNSDPRQLGLSFDWLNVSPYEHVAVDDFDAATKGTGWDVSEFDAQNNTFRWMSTTESTLELPYHPVGDTAIIIRLNNVLTSEIWNSLSVSCRNHPIVLSRVGNPPDVYYCYARRCLDSYAHFSRSPDR